MDELAPRRRRLTRPPPAAPVIDVFEDPPVEPPLLRPLGFLSRLFPAPQHSLSPLRGRYIACGALDFSLTNRLFMRCYKEGDVLLPRIRKPPQYLYNLFTGSDPLCRRFRANIRAYRRLATDDPAG